MIQPFFLKKNNKNPALMEWNNLSTTEQIDDLIKESYNTKVAIFKHSTSCNVSKSAYDNLERDLKSFKEQKFGLYFLDLIRYRSVSNYIEEKLSVRHESPQIIVLENGKVIYHESHFQIKAEALMSV
jgi:bacillithiol system protein YtxJ